MDFEEKIDAMRTTLELAVHDIEANRVAMVEVRSSIAELRSSIRELYGVVHEQRLLADADRDGLAQLRTITAQLVVVAGKHQERLDSIEKRI